MAWQSEMTRILRNLIDDIDATSYSQTRLEEIIIVASQLMLTSVDFVNTYSIDVEQASLSPDPTELSDKDNDFINLVVVKAALIILNSELKTHAAQSYRITDGPATIDIGKVYENKMDLYQQMKKDFEFAVLQYKIGNGSGGQAILSPYTVSLI